MLLTGSPRAAQAVVLEAFADAGEKIHHFRNGKSCEAWLVAKVRSRLLNKSPQPAAETAPETPENSPSTALDMAERFSRLQEPGRSALALLYLNRFTVQEIGQILQMPPEQLGDAAGSAREALQQMDPARSNTPASTKEQEP